MPAFIWVISRSAEGTRLTTLGATRSNTPRASAAALTRSHSPARPSICRLMRPTAEASGFPRPTRTPSPASDSSDVTPLGLPRLTAMTGRMTARGSRSATKPLPAPA